MSDGRLCGPFRRGQECKHASECRRQDHDRKKNAEHGTIHIGKQYNMGFQSISIVYVKFSNFCSIMPPMLQGEGPTVRRCDRYVTIPTQEHPWSIDCSMR